MQDEKQKLEISLKDYKEIMSEFFDKDYIIESEYINYRIDRAGQRFYVRYFNDGTYIKAPSFSTIMSTVLGVNPILAQWMSSVGKEQADFEKTYSAYYGTFFHVICSDILRGRPVTLDEVWFQQIIMEWCHENDIDFDELWKWYKQKERKICDDVLGFICWVKEYNVRPIAMEYPLMHPKGLWAGTADLICKIQYDSDDIIALVDIKSTLQGFYESNEIQLLAYSRLWNIEHPHISIDRFFNYGCNSFRRQTLYKYLKGRKSGIFKPYKFKDQTESPNLYKWDLYIKIYHGQPDNMKFKKIFEYDAIAEINRDSDLTDIIKEYDLFNNLTEKQKGEENEK